MWAVDTGYRTMNTVEELHSNKRGKYSDDTRLEMLHALKHNMYRKRYMASYRTRRKSRGRR